MFQKRQGEVEMPLYTFRMHWIDRIIDAFHFEDALREAGVRKGDEYELIEEEDLEYECFLYRLSVTTRSLDHRASKPTKP
jgi:hypothetical protein